MPCGGVGRGSGRGGLVQRTLEREIQTFITLPPGGSDAVAAGRACSTKNNPSFPNRNMAELRYVSKPA